MTQLTLFLMKSKKNNQEELHNVWIEGYNNIENIYKNYEKNPKPSKINSTRTEMANKAKIFARQSREGIYKLELPTGERVIIVMGA